MAWVQLCSFTAILRATMWGRAPLRHTRSTGRPRLRVAEALPEVLEGWRATTAGSDVAAVVPGNGRAQALRRAAKPYIRGSSVELKVEGTIPDAVSARFASQ